MNNKMTEKQCVDIGFVGGLLYQAKSEAEAYEAFEAVYNGRGQNPWWEDKAPDEVFTFILDVIGKANLKKETVK